MSASARAAVIRGLVAFALAPGVTACGGQRPALAPAPSALAPVGDEASGSVPTGEVREAISELVSEAVDGEGFEVTFTGGQAGEGALRSAARADVEQDGVLRRWLLIEAPSGWWWFEDDLLEGSVAPEGDVSQHKERASTIVRQIPDVGTLLVIEIDRAEEHTWGTESSVVRWYCFVEDGSPACYEVEVSWSRLELDGDAVTTTGWTRDVDLEGGILVIGATEGDDGRPMPAAGRYRIRDLALVRGVAEFTSTLVVVE